MEANYLAGVLPVTLRFEGGYADNPSDPGGATEQGITQAEYDRYRDSRHQPRRAVRLMGQFELEDIYHNRYWIPVGGQTLSVGLDLVAFDAAVNNGVARAQAWLHECRNSDVAQAITDLSDRRLSFDQSLTKLWRVFGRGWARRVTEVMAIGLRQYHAASGHPEATGPLLHKRAHAAADKGATRATVGGHVLAGGAVTAPAQGALHAPLSLILATLAVAAVAAAVLIWQGLRHKAIAEVLTDQANQAGVPHVQGT